MAVLVGVMVGEGLAVLLALTVGETKAEAASVGTSVSGAGCFPLEQDEAAIARLSIIIREKK